MAERSDVGGDGPGTALAAPPLPHDDGASSETAVEPNERNSVGRMVRLVRKTLSFVEDEHEVVDVLEGARPSASSSRSTVQEDFQEGERVNPSHAAASGTEAGTNNQSPIARVSMFFRKTNSCFFDADDGQPEVEAEGGSETTQEELQDLPERASYFALRMKRLSLGLEAQPETPPVPEEAVRHTLPSHIRLGLAQRAAHDEELSEIERELRRDLIALRGASACLTRDAPAAGAPGRGREEVARTDAILLTVLGDGTFKLSRPYKIAIEGKIPEESMPSYVPEYLKKRAPRITDDISYVWRDDPSAVAAADVVNVGRKIM